MDYSKVHEIEVLRTMFKGSLILNKGERIKNGEVKFDLIVEALEDGLICADPYGVKHCVRNNSGHLEVLAESHKARHKARLALVFKRKDEGKAPELEDPSVMEMIEAEEKAEEAKVAKTTRKPRARRTSTKGKTDEN